MVMMEDATNMGIARRYNARDDDEGKSPTKNECEMNKGKGA